MGNCDNLNQTSAGKWLRLSAKIEFGNFRLADVLAGDFFKVS
jgi:hypothetical protein